LDTFNPGLDQYICAQVLRRANQTGLDGFRGIAGREDTTVLFGSFMEGLRSSNLVNALKEVARRGDPLLGICVGMQAFLEIGKEMGEHQGLGLVPGQVIRFPEFKELKVPHTGWNQLVQQRDSQLFENLQDGAYAYFNHSYYCELQDADDALSLTDYGLTFASAIQRGNLFGVQFHPEKSQRVGQTILANFFKV